MSNLLQDLRYAIRMLFKSPGFAAVAILTLALGIGANTAIFSVVNSVVLQPLPYPHPEQLVVISQTVSDAPSSGGLQSSESYLDFLDWQRQAKSFSSLAAYQYNQMTLTGRGSPTVLQGALASSSLFSTLGVAPLLGRTLQPQDDAKGAAFVVVIGEALWRGQLGADPNIVGKALQLDSEAFTVVGVMPADFRYPDQSPASEFWIPAIQSLDYAAFMDLRGPHFLSMIGRLKPGVTAATAESELNVIYAGLVKQYSNTLNPVEVQHVSNLKRLVVGDTQNILLILLGAVGLVVLIACANIANLLLARATGRAKEIAVRVALGAGRGRIFRQLLTESVLLGVCAGIAGLLLAYWGVAAIKTFASDQLPHLSSIQVDGWVLAFTFALSVFAGVLFGLAPAWQSSEIDLNEVLRESGRGSTGSAKRRWTRDALVVVEVSLAVILLIGSGLLLKSFYVLTHSSPGFDPQNILVGSVELPKAQYVKPEQWNAFFRQAVERLKSVPGVEDAAAALPTPFTGSNLGYGFEIVGAPPLRNQSQNAAAHAITPDYFRVMRMPLIRGREFTDAGTAPNAAKVVIVNQELVRLYFPNTDPLVHSLTIHSQRPDYQARIIGVVGNVKDNSMSDPPTPMLYFPYTQEQWWIMVFVLRTKGNPSSLASALQTQIHDIDSSLPVQQLRPMTSFISDSEGDARFRSLLLGLFGILALVLASVGIYSVLAYVVAQRTHEIGIRMALGAQPRDVLRLVVGQGMSAVLIGTAIGIAAALGLSQLLAQFLYGVHDRDPVTFISVTILLSLVAFAACYIPARRATKVDPLVALRYE